MKKTLTKSQKTMSAIVALTLGALVTLTAVMNTFGVTNNAEYANTILEEEILERAYADVTAEELEIVEIEEKSIIKVYDTDGTLLDTIELGENDEIVDSKDQNLVNRAEFLSEYNNTSFYRISK